MNKWANELYRQFSKEVQKANKYMKKFSTTLAVEEIQIIRTLRFYLFPFKMAIIRDTHNKCWEGQGEERPLNLLQFRYSYSLVWT
jgi:hypothetical protein